MINIDHQFQVVNEIFGDTSPIINHFLMEARLPEYKQQHQIKFIELTPNLLFRAHSIAHNLEYHPGCAYCIIDDYRLRCGPASFLSNNTYLLDDGKPLPITDKFPKHLIDQYISRIKFIATAESQFCDCSDCDTNSDSDSAEYEVFDDSDDDSDDEFRDQLVDHLRGEKGYLDIDDQVTLYEYDSTRYAAQP